MLLSLVHAWASWTERLPPVIFLATTIGRRARSAGLFVGSSCSSQRNRVSSARCFFTRLCSRLAWACCGSILISASSRFSILRAPDSYFGSPGTAHFFLCAIASLHHFFNFIAQASAANDSSFWPCSLISRSRWVRQRCLSQSSPLYAA